MLCQRKCSSFLPPLVIHRSLENLNKDLVRSQVSSAFVPRVLNSPGGFAALSVDLSLHYAVGIPVLWSLILLILTLLTWLTGLNLTSFITVDLHGHHWDVAQTVSSYFSFFVLLAQVPLDCTLASWEHWSSLPCCNHWLLLTFLLMTQPSLAFP